jgi:transposase InsO family protein
MTQQQRDIKRKLAVLEHARVTGNVAKTARHFGISRQCYYKWKQAYEEFGDAGLINKKPCPENLALRTPAEIEDKILHLRRVYHFGPTRIAWYLGRYHGFTISSNGVYCVLKRAGLNRLPANCRKRSIISQRYEKQVPGHHVQVDVKFLQFTSAEGRRIKRYQFTAIDDATRVRALKIYEKHTQASAIDFIDHVIERFPFRIHTIRTDNGHEFQAKFHWHVEDLGMRHVYIRPRSPNLNGKVERSHLTDQLEFYQLLDYVDDVDLREKLAVWEEFYNVHRPHSGLKGLTPYEVLKEKLVS